MLVDQPSQPVVIQGDFRRTDSRRIRRGPLLLLLAIILVSLAGGLALQQLWPLALGIIVSLIVRVIQILRTKQSTVKLRLEDSLLTINGDGYQIRLEAPFRYATGVQRKPMTSRKDETCFVRMVLDVYGKPLVLEEQVLAGYLPPKLDEITGLSSALGMAELTSFTAFPGTLWELIQHIETRLPQGGTEKIDIDIASLFRLGNQQFKDRIYSEAIGTFTAIIKLRPDSALAYYSRGAARYQHRVDLDNAINDLSTSLRLEPDQFRVYRMRGLVHGQTGDWAAMREDCTKAIRLQGSSADLYNLRGSACFRLQDYEAAISDFDRAIQLDNSKPEPLYNRGLVWQRQMKLPEAIADFQSVLRLNPRFDAATRSIVAIQNQIARQRPAGTDDTSQQGADTTLI